MPSFVRGARAFSWCPFKKHTSSTQQSDYSTRNLLAGFLALFGSATEFFYRICSAPLARALCVPRALKVRCGVVAAEIRCLIIHMMLQDCWRCFCATFFNGQPTRAPSHRLNGGKPVSVSTPRSLSNASCGRRARRGACCGSSWSAPVPAPWRRGVGGRCCWRALRRHQDLP